MRFRSLLSLAAVAPAILSAPPVPVRTNQNPLNIEDGLAVGAAEALVPQGKEKIAFLTFDDGPSTETPRILKILKQAGAKATFFVVGSMAARYPKQLEAILAAGHAIGNHSYTHNYAKLYRSTQTMLDEINKTESVLEKTLGPTFSCKLFRFPGGYMGHRKVFKGHKEVYAQALHDGGMEFIDWNVDCGDTHPVEPSVSQIVHTVMRQCSGMKRVVVLMHDPKSRTVAALPAILKGLQKRGYQFKTLK